MAMDNLHLWRKWHCRTAFKAASSDPDTLSIIDRAMLVDIEHAVAQWIEAAAKEVVARLENIWTCTELSMHEGTTKICPGT